MDRQLKHLQRLFLVMSFLIAVSGQSQIRNMMPETADSGMGGTNAIEGRVSVQSGQILERRVAVRLSTMTKGDVVAMTDDRGNFAFRGLVSGTYTITIDKEKDFEPSSQQVQIIQLRGSPPQTYNLSMRLTPKSGVIPRASVVDAALTALPEKGRTLFLRSQELAKVGNHAGSIEQLKLLTSEYPNFMPGFNELGLEYLKTNDLAKADTAFQEAIKLQPDAFAPQMNRGIVLVTLKRYAEAELVLQLAKKLDERSATVVYFLGQALANLGKFDEAEKELTKAISSGGDEMKEAHRILAIIYSSRGEKKRASAELETYLKIYPSAPDAEQLRKTLQLLKPQ
jgi:tetratricopeptide (TPR) repeat protein